MNRINNPICREENAFRLGNGKMEKCPIHLSIGQNNVYTSKKDHNQATLTCMRPKQENLRGKETIYTMQEK